MNETAALPGGYTPPVWRGSKERQDPLRDLLRRTLPNGNAGHVAEDLDLVCRAFLSGWPRDKYRALLSQLAGTVLTDADIDSIVRGRDALDAVGMWMAAEVKACKPGCDHTVRRSIPLDLSLQHSKFMTFNQCLRLDAPNCAGFFLIHMEHEDPMLSKWIIINGLVVGLRGLVLVLACRPDLAQIPTYDMREAGL